MIPSNAVLAVVGVSFYQDNLRDTQEGDRVFLAHQTDNPHDKYAVVVRNASGDTVGHLPKNLAPRFTDPERGGITAGTWTGTIVELTEFEQQDGSPGIGIRIRCDSAV
jgi:hypothetical protein